MLPKYALTSWGGEDNYVFVFESENVMCSPVQDSAFLQDRKRVSNKLEGSEFQGWFPLRFFKFYFTPKFPFFFF